MASYGVKYVFRFESTNKTNIEIQILQKNYQGARTYRSLGRAPILKREKSGCIHGSSLELYAECQIDAEFASLYTSSADEYKVEIYKIDEFLGDTIMRRLWSGFVSPELYSEPDIAPPYDVQIIATDGLGELKNYDFETRGVQTIGNHISHLLEHTGLSQELNVVSFMAGNSGTVPITDVAVSLDHMAGESCYDVLKAVLDSFHAEIACQDGYWMIWRETDFVNLSSQVEVAEFGSKTKADWWPVGQMSTVIEPAKKKVVVISENAYKDNVLKDIPYHANGATFDSEEQAFVLPAADTSVFKTLNFGEEVGYKLSLSVTARNVGAGEEGQNVGIKVKIGGRSYMAGDTFWLKETTNGKTAWSNVEGLIEKTLEAPSTSDSSKEAQTIVLELPLYHYNNRAYHYATSIEVTVINLDGNYPIHVYDVALSKLDRQKGYKSAVVIDNGAREESEEVTLILADNERIPASAQIFMDGIALDADGNPIGTWASGRLAALKYLAFMSRDYALSVALPRMKVQGVLNVPESALITPVLFLRDNTYYFPETYSYDLLNDEMSVNLISIPTASISVVSEEVTEVIDPFQSRPGSSAGGGSSSGGSSGGGEGSGEDSLIFEFEFDSATNKATAEMVAALAEAIAADKLILCNGRTYKFILEDGGMYGLVSDAYMDITDGKLKTSILAVTASTYDVQLMEEVVPVGTEITEATIRNWGFTKNAGTITGIKMNGATKGTSGVVDLGTVITAHQQLKTINGQSILGSGNITIQGGGATPRVEMTETSAVLQPNTFHVWPMMDELNLTLGAEQSGVMNRYLFQFRNPKGAVTMLTLPDDITWSEDTELDENGMPVMEAAAFYRIEIIEGLASLKKWKLVYINFADAEVERVLMANGIGDGIGITKREAKKVTSIGTWFQGNEDIKSFDELAFFIGVTELSEEAFEGCTALKSIGLDNIRVATRTFGNGSFSGCTSLKKVVMPAIEELKWTFMDCTSLEAADIGENCTSIAWRTFQNCPMYDLVCRAVVPPTMEDTSLSATCMIYVPDESVEAYKTAPGWSSRAAYIKGISEYDPSYDSRVIVFADPAVAAIILSNFGNKDDEFTQREADAVTSLGTFFRDNTEITSFDELNDFHNVTVLKDGVFSGCTSLESIGLDNITDISRTSNTGVFNGCTALKAMTMPKVVNLAWSFMGCTSLAFAEIGENCTTIAWRTFQNCPMTTLICRAVTPPSMADTSLKNTCMIYVPDESVEAYKAANGWSGRAAYIKGISEYTG